MRMLVEQPGESELRATRVALGSKAGECGQELAVLLERIRLKPGHAPSKVIGLELIDVDDLTGQEGATQRTVRDKGNSQRATRLQHLGLRTATPQRVF